MKKMINLTIKFARYIIFDSQLIFIKSLTNQVKNAKTNIT